MEGGRLRRTPVSGERAGTLAGRFHAARHDPGLVVLEGLHALKHAQRFGADLLQIVMSDDATADALASDLAPDTLPLLAAALRVSPAIFAQLAPVAHPTGVMALARRPSIDTTHVLDGPGGSIVLLERPTHAGNIGAAVRVAAAAGAAALLVLAGEDPWSPAAVRGGAGLQFALPVARLDAIPAHSRALVAVHPDGVELTSAALPADGIYAFGSERTGLSAELLGRATRRIRIPMRAGVSSLNLATAVAVILYHGVRSGP